MANQKAAGCDRVEFFRFACHPPFHRPVPDHEWARTRREHRVDVSMVGISDLDRIPVVESLVARAPDLSIRLCGRGWSRSHSPMVTGTAYPGAMRASQFRPCSFRRSNRDRRLMRSFEIPAMRAPMLAEGTGAHLELFEQDVYCAHCSRPERSADQAQYLDSRLVVAQTNTGRGHELVLSGAHRYADRATQIDWGTGQA